MSESIPATEPGRTLSREQQALVDEFCRSLAGSATAHPETEPDHECTEPNYPDDPQLAKKAWFVMGYLIYGGVIKPPKLSSAPFSREASEQLDELWHIYIHCVGALEGIE